jgi:predicted DNA-binding protein
MKKTANSIVLRFYDAETIERLDNVAHSLNMSRSAYIRRCVIRGLEHTETHELPLLEHRAIRKALAQ